MVTSSGLRGCYGGQTTSDVVWPVPTAARHSCRLPNLSPHGPRGDLPQK